MVPLTEVLDESLQSHGKPNEIEVRVSCADISYQLHLLNWQEQKVFGHRTILQKTACSVSFGIMGTY